MIKCPRCGQRLEMVQAPLTFRQRRILRTVEEIERETGSPVSIHLIYPVVGVSKATVNNELAHLEHMNRVFRPNGKRSGWSPVKEPEIILVAATA